MLHKKRTGNTDPLNLAVDTMLDQKKAQTDQRSQKPKETRKERRQRKKADRLLRKKARKLILPKTVQESIPYKRVYPDSGLIETADGVFVRCYLLGDINYTMLQREEQQEIILRYAELLNSLDCASRFQILTYQQMRNKAEFEDLVLMEVGSDALSFARKEHNEILKDEIQKGRNEMHKPKYMCVEISAPDYSTAVNVFNRLDHNVV